MKRETGSYLFIAILAIAIFFTVYYLNVGPTGFAISEQSIDLSTGTHEGITDESPLTLLENQTSGTYTSEVFDAGESTSWNSLAVDESVPDAVEVSADENGSVDSAGYVLSGFDSSWSDLTLTALYDVTNNSSIDLANAALDASTGTLTNATENEYADVLISYTYTTSLNASLSYQARVSNDVNFTNSSFAPVSDLDALGLEGQYFQFLVTFESEDSEMSPSLMSVSVNYGEEDVVPGCTDEDAENYDSDATEDDGSCTYAEEEEDEESAAGGAAEDQPASSRAAFSDTEISSLSLSSGDSQDVTWTVTNVGNAPAIACMPVAGEDSEAWVSYSDDGVDLPEGASNEFTFTVSAPEGASGDNSLSVHVECLGGVVSSPRSFSVQVSGEASTASGTGTGSATGGTGTGAAVFGGIGTGGVILLVVVVLALAAALFVARTMRRSGKTLKDLFSKFRKQPQ